MTYNDLEPIDFKTFHKDYPVTFGIILVNVFVFIAFHLNYINPQVQLPQVLNTSAWTAHFFHAHFIHLASNMLTTIIMGFILERQIGHIKYAFIVLCTWNILVLLLYYFLQYPVYGFSGIALGLLAFATFYTRKRSTVYEILWPLLLINIFIGVFFPNISIIGHFLGAVSGGVVYIVLYFKKDKIFKNLF